MEIRIYIEGGGDSKDTKGFLRQGFSAFLKELNSMAREKHIRWQIVVCGGRNAAFDAFRTAMREHPQAFNVLLVDSEAPVQNTPWRHLQQRDHWDADGYSDDHCHLMAQAMEAWFVADIASLSSFYGAGFHLNSIPRSPDVEQISKSDLETSLKAATRETQKGEYHKISHASKLLETVDVAIVRQASRHCERLFTTLADEMEN